MQQIDFNALASQAMQGMTERGYLADAIYARNKNDFEMLTYYIARGLKLDFQAPVKFGLIWAVADAIDAMEAV